MSTLTDLMTNDQHTTNEQHISDEDVTVTIPDSYYCSADLIGQVERLRCSIVGLLNKNARLRIELQCQSHPHAHETPPPEDSRLTTHESWSV